VLSTASREGLAAGEGGDLLAARQRPEVALLLLLAPEEPSSRIWAMRAGGTSPLSSTFVSAGISSRSTKSRRDRFMARISGETRESIMARDAVPGIGGGQGAAHHRESTPGLTVHRLHIRKVL
jgi:hypothetical protein